MPIKTYAKTKGNKMVLTPNSFGVQQQWRITSVASDKHLKILKTI